MLLWIPFLSEASTYYIDDSCKNDRDKWASFQQGFGAAKEMARSALRRIDHWDPYQDRVFQTLFKTNRVENNNNAVEIVKSKDASRYIVH